MTAFLNVKSARKIKAFFFIALLCNREAFALRAQADLIDFTEGRVLKNKATHSQSTADQQAGSTLHVATKDGSAGASRASSHGPPSEAWRRARVKVIAAVRIQAQKQADVIKAVHPKNVLLTGDCKQASQNATIEESKLIGTMNRLQGLQGGVDYVKELGEAWSFQNSMWNRNQKCPTHDDRAFLGQLQKLYARGDAAKQGRFSAAVHKLQELSKAKRMPDNDAVANITSLLSGIQVPTASLVQLDEADQSDEGYLVEADQLVEKEPLDEEDQMPSASLVQLDERHLVKGWVTVAGLIVITLLVIALAVLFFATIGWWALLHPILYAMGLIDHFWLKEKANDNRRKLLS